MAYFKEVSFLEAQLSLRCCGKIEDGCSFHGEKSQDHILPAWLESLCFQIECGGGKLCDKSRLCQEENMQMLLVTVENNEMHRFSKYVVLFVTCLLSF